MNIVHITTFVQGGAGRILYELASFQKKNNHNVFVITSATEEPGYSNYSEYLDKLRNENIAVYKVDSTFKRDIVKNINVVRELRSLLITGNIDIIHAHAAIPAFVAINARAGIGRYIPVVQTMHGWGTNKTTMQEMTDITIMNGLDRVVTVSVSDKKLLEYKGLTVDKMITIYNGVEQAPEYEVDEDIVAALEEFRGNGYKVLGCIGTVCSRKNQELLLEAMNLIGHERKVSCIFVGEGDKLEFLTEKSKEYGLADIVKFYGYQKNASQYLKYLDVLVLPSTSEGLSIAVLEAFRERVLVVASDIDSFCEIISDHKTGFLFSNNNVTSLCAVLKEVLFNTDMKQREVVVNNAYLNYTSYFMKENMLARYDDLYHLEINTIHNV